MIRPTLAVVLVASGLKLLGVGNLQLALLMLPVILAYVAVLAYAGLVRPRLVAAAFEAAPGPIERPAPTRL